jgi:actin related protein 2/3 complex subunit 1A/1B
MSKPLCTSAITCHAFSKDGALCALCPNSNEIYIYETNGADDTAKWVKKWTLEEHSNYVTALDFNAEGVLVSCGQDRNAYVWKRVGNDWRPELCVLRLDRAATDVK